MSLDLLHPVTDDFDSKEKRIEPYLWLLYLLSVRISPKNRTEIEIDLNKKTEEMWKSIGNFRPNHLSIHSMQDSGMHPRQGMSQLLRLLVLPIRHCVFILMWLDPVYFMATLLKRSTVTHDTDWYTFSLPSSVYMSPPIGYHIRLKRLKEGSLVSFLDIRLHTLSFWYRHVYRQTLHGGEAFDGWRGFFVFGKDDRVINQTLRRSNSDANASTIEHWYRTSDLRLRWGASFFVSFA